MSGVLYCGVDNAGLRRRSAGVTTVEFAIAAGTAAVVIVIVMLATTSLGWARPEPSRETPAVQQAPVEAPRSQLTIVSSLVVAGRHASVVRDNYTGRRYLVVSGSDTIELLPAEAEPESPALEAVNP
jgi:hypothetical protein